MSTNLFWRNVPKSPSDNCLSKELKFIVDKHYYDNQHPFGGGSPVTLKGANDIAYFKGLADAGILDAKVVLELIEKYGEIQIYIK